MKNSSRPITAGSVRATGPSRHPPRDLPPTVHRGHRDDATGASTLIARTSRCGALTPVDGGCTVAIDRGHDPSADAHPLRLEGDLRAVVHRRAGDGAPRPAGGRRSRPADRDGVPPARHAGRRGHAVEGRAAPVRARAARRSAGGRLPPADRAAAAHARGVAGPRGGDRRDHVPVVAPPRRGRAGPGDRGAPSRARRRPAHRLRREPARPGVGQGADGVRLGRPVRALRRPPAAAPADPEHDHRLRRAAGRARPHPRARLRPGRGGVRARRHLCRRADLRPRRGDRGADDRGPDRPLRRGDREPRRGRPAGGREGRGPP